MWSIHVCVYKGYNIVIPCKSYYVRHIAITIAAVYLTSNKFNKFCSYMHIICIPRCICVHAFEHVCVFIWICVEVGICMLVNTHVWVFVFTRPLVFNILTRFIYKYICMVLYNKIITWLQWPQAFPLP